MSNLLTEGQVLNILGIKDFRSMSKDKLMQFASNIHRMDPEVAKKAIEQFPNFANLALESLKEYKLTAEHMVEANKDSSSHCLKIYNDIIFTLSKALEQDEISFEEKKYYIDQMVYLAEMAGAKDRENKKFHWGVLAAFGGIALVGLAVGATLLGGNTDVSESSEPINFL
ncbi:MAG: hypothetical protein R3Y63_11825 [Eubacteriales bacterium]